MPFINREIKLMLTWLGNCAITNLIDHGIIFIIEESKEAILYFTPKNMKVLPMSSSKLFRY